MKIAIEILEQDLRLHKRRLEEANSERQKAAEYIDGISLALIILKGHSATLQSPPWKQ